MENPETSFLPSIQFTEGKEKIYNELIDNVILWGFDLSLNFKSYQNFKEKTIIILQNDRNEIKSAKQWGPFYSRARQLAFEGLFLFSQKENLKFTYVLNDIKLKLIETNRLNSEIFTKQELNEEEKQKLKKWKTLCSSLSEFHSEHYREPEEADRIGHQLNVDFIKKVNIGVNSCKKIEKDGKTRYLKSFSYIEIPREQGINPKEPFLYKVLEYIGLGPHAEFIIGSSTSYGSNATILRTNYIMTTGEELHFDTPNEAEFYKAFLDSKNMDNVVEITFAALIRALLSLRDVFQENQGNYGITNDKRFLFIDHLPEDNDPFDSNILETYSPREHLQTLFKEKKGLSNLFNLKSIYDSQFNNLSDFHSIFVGFSFNI